MRTLRQIADELERVNQEYFAGKLHPLRLGWLPLDEHPKREKVIACYLSTDATICVTRLFELDEVPDCFVSWSLYHECLHMTHGDDHTLTFYEAEMKHKDALQALAWEHVYFDRTYDAWRAKIGGKPERTRKRSVSRKTRRT